MSATSLLRGRVQQVIPLMCQRQFTWALNDLGNQAGSPSATNVRPFPTQLASEFAMETTDRPAYESRVHEFIAETGWHKTSRGQGRQTVRG